MHALQLATYLHTPHAHVCMGQIAGGLPQFCKHHKVPSHVFTPLMVPAGSHLDNMHLTCQHVSRCDRRPSHGELADEAAHFCVWHKQPHHVNIAERRKREKLASKDAFFRTREGGDVSLDLPGSSVSISEDASVATGGGGRGKLRWSRKRVASAVDGEGRRMSGRGIFWDDSSLEEVPSSSLRGKGDGGRDDVVRESATQFVPPV
jgi:hypothetical protein